jgi:hypothetical protein
MSTKAPLKTEKELQKDGKKLTAGILLAVELESNFKLFSYRCIDKDNFLDRIDGLISIYKKAK